MPIYEYACTTCGKEFELLIRRASEKAACPHCRSARVAKQFSTYGVAVKGGGSASRGMPEAPSPRFSGDCGASYCKPGGCQTR